MTACDIFGLIQSLKTKKKIKWPPGCPILTSALAFFPNINNKTSNKTEFKKNYLTGNQAEVDVVIYIDINDRNNEFSWFVFF